MRSMSIDKKRLLINQKLVLDEKQTKPPQEYAKFLKDNQESIHAKELQTLIKSLRVELTCKDVSWVREFGTNQGHIYLLNILRNISHAQHHAKMPTDKKLPEFMFNIIMCIHSFMNIQVSFLRFILRRKS